MTLYYNLSNLINLYDKSLQWILNSFNVTKTHTILIYHIFRSPRPLLCLYIFTYVCIYSKCVFTKYVILLK